MLTLTAVPWMGMFKSLRWLNIAAKHAREIINSSFSKWSAMPLNRCLKNCSIYLRSSKTLASIRPRHTHCGAVNKNTVLSPTLLTKFVLNRRWFKTWFLRKFTALTTIDNILKIFRMWMSGLKFSGRVSLLLSLLCIPYFGASYPRLRTTDLA